MADLFTVLIETSWNVKVTNKGWRVWSSIVLIETSWNVKERVKGDGVESLWY